MSYTSSNAESTYGGDDDTATLLGPSAISQGNNSCRCQDCNPAGFLGELAWFSRENLRMIRTGNTSGNTGSDVHGWGKVSRRISESTGKATYSDATQGSRSSKCRSMFKTAGSAAVAAGVSAAGVAGIPLIAACDLVTLIFTIPMARRRKREGRYDT